MLQNPLAYNHKMFKLINAGFTQLENTKILIVGVGGIGCQILKVLCKMPIGSVHIIDMDTIELSNLNRQFLFKKEHKGMSKSLVARQTILKINPDLNITAHHKNIKELPITFFKQFSFLVMALDNIEARNYVNKIGVRLNIPIIDAGTLGYKGNVATIIPKQTKCYSCEPKSSQQKVYPVCTIRMRPEKPIHCIVWAKLLFEVLFGPENQDNDLKDLAQLAKRNDIIDIMIKLFESDILEIKNAKQDSVNKLSQIFAKSITTIPRELIEQHVKTSTLTSFNKHEDKLQIVENISTFAESFERLNQQKNQDSVITFEKDDDNIIHFISSAANLRMSCFSIERQSFNEIKNITGNIVPAIASTNSIVSGIQVVQMMKLAKRQILKMKTYFIQNLNTKVIALKTEANLPTCQICHLSSVPVIISANLTKYTLQNLVEMIKEKSPSLQEFSINYGSKEYFNSDEPNESLLQKSIMDLCSAYEVDLVITNEDTMKKQCVIWLIHDDQSKQNETKIENEEQLIVKHEQEQQIREQNTQGNKPPVQDDDSDIVMFDDEDSPDLEIIEVKKNVQPVQKPIQNQDQQKDEEIVLQQTCEKGPANDQVELIEQSAQSQKPQDKTNGKSLADLSAEKRQPQTISIQEASSDSVKKKVKQNEVE